MFHFRLIIFITVFTFNFVNFIQAEENHLFTVKWGIILPLSGPVAEAGIDLRRGYELALEDLSTNQIKHEAIFEDSQYLSKQAVASAQKLINVDKVDVLVGLWETADVIAPLAEQHNLLHVSIRWNSDIAEKFRNTFTFESTYKTYTQLFLSLLQKLGYKNFSILGQESNGWNLSEEEFKKNAKDYGLTVLSTQRYLPDETDFNLLALKVLKDQPEVILINDVSKSLELITKKIKSLNPEQKVTGYLGFPNIDYSLFEGMYYVNQLSLNADFESRFEKEYGMPVYNRAQLAFDQMKIVASAYDNFKQKPAVADLKKQLQAIKTFQGMSGLINNKTGKVFETTCVVRRILNGKDVPASEIN